MDRCRLIAVTKGFGDLEGKSGEEIISYVARVSNPKNQENWDTAPKLLKFLSDNKHWCYADKTEVFTDSGWKFFEDLDNNDKLAAVDPFSGHFIFETPKRLTVQRYKGKLINIQDSNCDLLVTPSHRCCVQLRHSKGYKPLEVIEAHQIVGKQERIPITAKYAGSGEGSWSEGAFIGFSLGDGFQSGKEVHFRLKKERKINFLLQLLTDLNYDHEVLFKKNVTLIKVKTNLQIGKTPNKEYLGELTQKSSEFLLGMFDGLMASDGSPKRSRGYTFSSSSPKIIELVEFLSVVSGRSVVFSRKRHTTNPNHNVNIVVNIRGRKFCTIRKKPRELDYEGNVYCATVSTGFLLVRKNGRQVVSGNSPFEHSQMTIEVKTSRAIAQQILRHRSFVFQEFSGRYQKTDSINIYEARRQDKKNRQNSIDDLDPEVKQWFLDAQQEVWNLSQSLYQKALDLNIAKECARFLLPLNTATTLYITGNVRSWIFYLDVRCHESTQKEHREIAEECKKIFVEQYPNVGEALGWV